MTETALVLVCKRPSSGVGKQRIAATFGREGAVRIAEALLACALEDARDWSGPVVVSPADPPDCGWAAALLPQLSLEVRVESQKGGNLGQRLNALDHKLRGDGLEQLVYIGSDSPALSPKDYAEVRQALQNHDVVLKPAADGGVVLMASRKQWPMLSALPWSTARLGSTLAHCCRAAGQSVAMLTQGFDVDEKEDVLRLAAVLKTDQRPARRELCLLASDIVRMREPVHVQI
ncbi:MAG: DUF2064 domain-containing protein [Nitrosospira sp.]|nr:DUF2064 domain-containing protein [Nitrosospira sp.]